MIRTGICQLKIILGRLGIVVHACNPSPKGLPRQEDCYKLEFVLLGYPVGSRSAWAAECYVRTCLQRKRVSKWNEQREAHVSQWETGKLLLDFFLASALYARLADNVHRRLFLLLFLLSGSSIHLALSLCYLVFRAWVRTHVCVCVIYIYLGTI